MMDDHKIRLARLQGELEAAKYIRDGLKGGARHFAEIKIKEIEARLGAEIQSTFERLHLIV